MRPSLLAMIVAANLGIQVGGVLPIVASIPALYSTVYNFPGATNAPQPYFSLGMGSNANPTVATSIYLDTSLVSQGGTGVLKDDLMLYDDANRSTYLPAHLDFGPGDSSGFGVINGELMLVDDQAYINRGSGPTRKMYWIQTLGQTTITQPITLTIDTRYARVHNNSTYTNRASLTNPNQINLTNADYPITQLFPRQIAGISSPVSVPDSYILAGNMKRAIRSGSGATMDIVLHDYLTAGLNGANPGTVARANTDKTVWFTVSQGDMGKTAIPVISTPNPGGVPLERIVDGFDFRGLWTSLNQVGYVFTNCLFDASALNLAYTYISPGGVQPDHNFVLRNVRLDPNDTSGLRRQLIADNLADLVTSTNARQASTSSVNGFTVARAMYASSPGTVIEDAWNPFYTPTSTSGAAAITIDPSGQFITLTTGMTAGKVLPAGLCCTVYAPNLAGRTSPLTTDVGQFIYTGIEMTMQNCRIDGHASQCRYGYNFTGFLLVAGGSQLFGSVFKNGYQRGLLNNAIVRAPQDIIDVPGGLRQGNLVTSAEIANGSHVDGTQTTGGSGITTYTTVMTIDGDYIDCRPRHYNQDFFVDPLDINGLTTNPYFLAYGATDKTFRMRTGGLDALLYLELDNGPFNLSPVTMKNCVARGGYYFFLLHQPNVSLVTFSNTNPMTFSSSYRSTPNTLAAPTNAESQGRQLGLMIGDSAFPGTSISFNADVGLPSNISPSTVYTVVAYGYSQIYVTSTNTTANFAVGDILILSSTGATGTTSTDPNVYSMKAQVTEIDGGTGTGVGQVTKLSVISPGLYKYRPTALTMNGFTTAGGTGQLTIANGTDQTGSTQSGTVNSFVIADASGNTLDGTGNAKAGNTFASLALSSSNNTTANFAAGDTLYMSSESSGLAKTVTPATITVQAVDGSGKITAISLLSGGNYAVPPSAARLNAQTGGTAASGTLTMSKLSAVSSSASGTLQVTGLGLATSMRPQTPALITVHDNYVSEMPPGNTAYLSSAKLDARGKARFTGDNTSANRVGTDAVSYYGNYFLLDPWQYGYVDGTGQTLTPGGVPLPGMIPPAPALKYFSINPPPNALANYTVAALGAGSVKLTFTSDPNSTVSPDVGLPGVTSPMNPSGYMYRATPNGGSVSAPKPLPSYPTDNGDGTSSVIISDASLTGNAFLIECCSVNAYNAPQIYPQQIGPYVGVTITMP